METMNRPTRRNRGAQSGFTLIELLVVIAVLAILAAIVIFNVVGVTNRGSSSACQTDTKSVQTASDAYFNDKKAYPDHGGGAADVTTTAATDPVEVGELVPAYLHTAPGNGETFTYKDANGTVQGFVSGSATAC